jgi:hypothetical protein
MRAVSRVLKVVVVEGREYRVSSSLLSSVVARMLVERWVYYWDFDRGLYVQEQHSS